MGNLIPFAQRFIAGICTRTVSARKLHEFLDVKRDFSNWIKGRITQYDFEQNQDFILIRQNGRIKKQGGDRKSVDYYLTIDMAKELAMVERNEKGKQARRYFIDCEKKLLQSKQQQQRPKKPYGLKELPNNAGQSVSPELAAYRQRYLVSVREGKPEVLFIPEDAMLITTEQLPNCISWYMPEYRLVKKERLNVLEKQLKELLK